MGDRARRAFDIALAGLLAAVVCIACACFIMWQNVAAFWEWEAPGRIALLYAAGAAMWTRYWFPRKVKTHD